LGEKVGARSVILPTIHSQELPGIYLQEKPGATGMFWAPVAVVDPVPLEDPDTYEGKALLSDISVKFGTILRV
jgi:hypothetical protein